MIALPNDLISAVAVTVSLFVGVLLVNGHQILSLLTHVLHTAVAEFVRAARLAAAVTLALHDLAADGVRSLVAMTGVDTLHLDVLHLCRPTLVLLVDA